MRVRFQFDANSCKAVGSPGSWHGTRMKRSRDQRVNVESVHSLDIRLYHLPLPFFTIAAESREVRFGTGLIGPRLPPYSPMNPEKVWRPDINLARARHRSPQHCSVGDSNVIVLSLRPCQVKKDNPANEYTLGSYLWTSERTHHPCASCPNKHSLSLFPGPVNSLWSVTKRIFWHVCGLEDKEKLSGETVLSACLIDLLSWLYSVNVWRFAELIDTAKMITLTVCYRLLGGFLTHLKLCLLD